MPIISVTFTKYTPSFLWNPHKPSTHVKSPISLIKSALLSVFSHCFISVQTNYRLETFSWLCYTKSMMSRTKYRHPLYRSRARPTQRACQGILNNTAPVLRRVRREIQIPWNEACNKTYDYFTKEENLVKLTTLYIATRSHR